MNLIQTDERVKRHILMRRQGKATNTLILQHEPNRNSDLLHHISRLLFTVKGVSVPTMEDKGKQYAVYLKGIMNLPFMLGWQTCGYLETCAGTSDATGKSQTGYFDPMGKPIIEALNHAQAANEQALVWHQQAEKLNNVYSTMKRSYKKPRPKKQAALKKPR